MNINNKIKIPPEITESVISNNSFLDQGVIIKNSNIGNNVKCYKFSNIGFSEVGNNSIIGDLSKIDHCNLGVYNKIEKYNHLYYVKSGNYSYTGPYCVMMHCNIGKFCSVSWGITIGGAEHNYKKVSSHAFLYNSFFELIDNQTNTYDRFEKPCKLGNDVWVGANATILRGVNIGDGAIIGANSLINKDVPPYAIMGGNPAKILKFRFEESIIEKLLILKWWDLPPEVIKNNIHLFNMDINNDTVDQLMELKNNQ